MGGYMQIICKYCCFCLVAQSCPTLCGPMDCSPLGSSVHGISQARILEWVAISFFRGSFLGIESVSPELQVDSSPLAHQGSPYANTFTVLYKGFEHPWSLVSAEGSGANPLLTLRVNVFSKYSCGFCTFKPNVSLNGKALVCKRARKVNYLICKNQTSL